MILTKPLAAALSMAALALPAQADAATYLFTLSGTQTASFTIDTDINRPVGQLARVDFTNVAGTFNGTGGTASVIRFFQSVSNGGFNAEIGSDLVIDNTGPQLFTGPNSAPVFVLGSHRLSTGSLRIAAAIPEPATWAMMLVGFAGIAIGLRRRRRGVDVPATLRSASTSG